MTSEGDNAPQQAVSAQASSWRELIAVPKRPIGTIVVAYLLSISGSLLLAAILSLLVPKAQPPDFSFFYGKGALTIAALAVISPLIETLILAGTTSLLLRFIRPQYAVLLSSFGWAIAHSAQFPIWGLVIWWPFIVFTVLYVVWKKRSLAWGIFMPFAVHCLQNLLPAIAVGYPGLLPVPLT